MEITEPVILEIPQGRKKVRVELTSRADARDLIAAIATAMLRLPDDGEGHTDSHGERGGMSGDELDTAIGYLRREELQKALHYAHGYCAAGVEQAVTYERRHAPHDDGTSYCTSLPEHDHADGQGGEDGPVDDEAELRRAEKLRDDWEPVLAGLGERVAALSAEPQDEDGPCMMVGCGHDLDDHSLDLERGDRLYCQRCECRQYLSAAAMQSHRSVRLLRDGDALVVVESTPCPERHPAKQTPCVAGEHHGPPCRDLDGDEWAPALTAVSS